MFKVKHFRPIEDLFPKVQRSKAESEYERLLKIAINGLSFVLVVYEEGFAHVWFEIKTSC